MEEDSFELATDPVTETGHCKNTTLTATETRSPPRRELDGGYENSRFNAMRHGVLSVHTVLPWEDKAEYERLLNALVEEHAPHGPTEDHLIEEIAGVIWRKRRLRLAEAASYRRRLEDTAGPFSLNILKRALIQVEPIVDALTAAARETTEDLPELKKRQASAQKALKILSTGIAGAYEAALAKLDESTRSSWQEQLAPEPADSDEDEDPDEDAEPYTADATGLAEYIEGSVLPDLAEDVGYVENRHLIRAQLIGEALDCTRLEQLGRYEVHLDRKLERTLAMLLRLQDLRRSKESG
jgi:hypothetical protein